MPSHHRVQLSHLSDVPPSDEVLVARAQQGDAQAFRDLYLRHARAVAGVVTRLMGDDAELDDIVQDAFIRANERLDSLRNPDQVRSWLMTIALRFARDRMARRRRRGAITRQFVHAIPTQSDPRDRAAADELYAALARLSEDLRIPWSLHRIEGEKLEDVARLCGVSLATVKRRIAQAQTRLDRRMGRSS